VRTDAGDQRLAQVGEVVDVRTHAGGGGARLDGARAAMTRCRLRAEAGVEVCGQRGVQGRPTPGVVGHERGASGSDVPGDLAEHRGELDRAQPRQVGAQGDRHRARPATHDLGHGLDEGRVEVLAGPVGHHLAAERAHRGRQAEVVGDDQDGLHAGRRGGCLGGVERERLGHVAAHLVAQSAESGLPDGRRLDGDDDHAPGRDGRGLQRSGHRDDSPIPDQRAGGVRAPG
jgi:hypothetical protein